MKVILRTWSPAIIEFTNWQKMWEGVHKTSKHNEQQYGYRKSLQVLYQ